MEMSTEKLNIIHLPKEQWQNVPISRRYTKDEYCSRAEFLTIDEGLQNNISNGGHAVQFL